MNKQTKLSPELVREVTAKVIALWKRDLRLMQERKRNHRRTQRVR
jgi:hypothetical protein